MVEDKYSLALEVTNIETRKRELFAAGGITEAQLEKLSDFITELLDELAG